MSAYRSILISISAFVALNVSAASAGEWRGGHLGVHAGYAFGQTDVDENSPPGLYTTSGIQSWDYDSDGFIGGAQAGFDWQSGDLVYGTELRLGWLDLDGNAPAPASCLGSGCDTVSSAQGDFYAALRGRLGIDLGKTLAYASAGVIGADTDVAMNDVCDTGPCGGYLLAASRSDFRVGWTAGIGLDFAAGSNWMIGVEYFHYDLGNETVLGDPTSSGVPVAGTPSAWQHDIDGDAVQINLNFKL